MDDKPIDMKIIDYKRLFEITYDGGWSDDNVWYAKCKFCDALPIFNIYAVKDWNILNSDQRKKRFYAAIKRHIKTYHPELILPKRTKILEEQETALINALHFLKYFPFRPYVKEELLKVWKPGNIVLPHTERKRKNQSQHKLKMDRLRQYGKATS